MMLLLSLLISLLLSLWARTQRCPLPKPPGLSPSQLPPELELQQYPLLPHHEHGPSRFLQLFQQL
jgi:hypothetical protein